MDYEWETTIWNDFSIADKFGQDAILETYNKIRKEWGHNIICMTELALTTNWKCWYYYDLKDEDMSMLYERLYYDTKEWIYNEKSNFSEEDLKYFFEKTD